MQQLVAQAWQATDPTEARRTDILLNHLLQLQILHGQLVLGEAPPKPDGAA